MKYAIYGGGYTCRAAYCSQRDTCPVMVYHGMVKVAGNQLSSYFVSLLSISMGHGGDALLCISQRDIMRCMVVCKVGIARDFRLLVLFCLIDRLMNLMILCSLSLEFFCFVCYLMGLIPVMLFCT